jgi:uncharacterized protein (DUF2147 family)
MRFLTTLVVLLLVLPASVPSAAADARLASPAGLWEALDGHGNSEGLIRIFEVKGLYYGRIEPSSPSDDRNAKCTRCTDYRHNQPLIGLVLMRHLRPESGEYVGGDLLDPDTGHIWGCTLRLTDGGRQLIVRGFFGISLLGRSQIWKRVG